MRKLPVVLLLTIAASLVSSASATIVLNINTTTKTFWLTGSAVGNFSTYNYTATWAWFSNSSRSDVGLVGTPSAIATNSNGTPISSVRIGNSSGGFTFSLTSYNTSTTTLTGSGLSGVYSYAGAAASTIAGFESGIGHTATETEGSTFGALSVQPGAPVPEPGTWAAAAMLLGGAGFAGWRRRRA